jgi:hypothetical protein
MDVVVLATGSVVIDAKLDIPFIAFTPFIGVAAGVYIYLSGSSKVKRPLGEARCRTMT